VQSPKSLRLPYSPTYHRWRRRVSLIEVENVVGVASIVFVFPTLVEAVVGKLGHRLWREPSLDEEGPELTAEHVVAVAVAVVAIAAAVASAVVVVVDLPPTLPPAPASATFSKQFSPRFLPWL